MNEKIEFKSLEDLGKYWMSCTQDSTIFPDASHGITLSLGRQYGKEIVNLLKLIKKMDERITQLERSNNSSNND